VVTAIAADKAILCSVKQAKELAKENYE